MRKIRIIHIVQDDKFVDGPLDSFENDGRFINKCYIIVDTVDYQFKYIKKNERINPLYTKQMIKDVLQRKDYDAIYFHSLHNYHIFKYIPRDKIVIWWSWGYDIYGEERFLNIPLYKPLTQQYLRNQNTSPIARIKQMIKKIPYVIDIRDGSRKRALRRIDYFQPVIHNEYLMMKELNGFKAVEFYYPRAHSYQPLIEGEMPNHNGDIIIGNSASYTNNHFDVWDKIKSFIPQDTNVIIPINYGNMKYAEYISNNIRSDTVNVRFLRDFLPKNEYFELVDNCGYAVFGVIRQQAIGNIFRCLAKGVKLFLYRESVPYKYLVSLGCIIFAIEEIDGNSFKVPLTIEQARHNQLSLMKDITIVNQARENAIEAIQRSLMM